jgi:predicted amidohydrolase
MSVSPRIEDNLPRILDSITAAKGDFIVFPEMSLTGYHGEFSMKATEAAWSQISAACRKAYVTALIGTGCKTADGTFIQTRIYTPDGELLGTHEKLVPTDGDRKFCIPGEELRTFQHEGLTFGCLICNDLWVTPGCGPYPDPRLTYQLGQQGAQIIFHGVNSGTSAAHLPYHESNLALRAMESNLYIATANAACADGPVNCTTGVMAPDGAWIAQCSHEGDHTCTVDIDFETD